MAQLKEDGADVQGVSCDLADREALRELVERLAAMPVGTLVNNAGIGELAAFERTTDEQWDRALRVNLSAAFELSRGLMPTLTRAGDGSIVNVLSLLAFRGTAGLAAYAVAKGGLAQLTQALAVEMGPRGVRCNAVAPGFIETDLFRSHHSAERRGELARASALRRLGTVEEVADAVAFLCGDGAGYVNGAVLAVDGGLMAQAAIPPLLSDERSTGGATP